MHNVTQNMRHICIHLSEQQQLKKKHESIEKFGPFEFVKKNCSVEFLNLGQI